MMMSARRATVYPVVPLLLLLLPLLAGLCGASDGGGAGGRTGTYWDAFFLESDAVVGAPPLYGSEARTHAPLSRILRAKDKAGFAEKAGLGMAAALRPSARVRMRTPSAEEIRGATGGDGGAWDGADVKEGSTFAVRAFVDEKLDGDFRAIGSHEGQRGEWTRLSAGGSGRDGPQGLLWRVAITVPGAASLTIVFSEMRVPERSVIAIADAATGEGLYIASVASFSPGADVEGHLVPPVPSDDVIVEVFIPEVSNSGVDYDALLSTKVAIRVERVMSGLKAERNDTSGTCNKDVNCAPDRIKNAGSGWRTPQESDSVVQILSAGPDSARWCTGSLINSVDTPGRQLLLTAAHCLWQSTNNPLGQHFWGFLFDFEQRVCTRAGSGVVSDGKYLQGAVIQYFDLATDIAVVEITSAIPESFNAYFSGWDARKDINVMQSLAIHHPNGDVKKISFNGGRLNKGCWCGNACECDAPTHWIVDGWDIGTTEKGSSGAALFDARTRRMVGALTGGAASCSNQFEADAFGMLSR